jgi:hypothetical protein
MRRLRIAGFERVLRECSTCHRAIEQIVGFVRLANKAAAFCRNRKDSNVRGKVTAGGL